MACYRVNFTFYLYQEGLDICRYSRSLSVPAEVDGVQSSSSHPKRYILRKAAIGADCGKECDQIFSDPECRVCLYLP